MFRLYRQIDHGEFFVVFGDTAQGGADSNFVQFMSRTRGDIPLVLQMRGVAAQMTPYLRDALHWIYNKTEVKPVVAIERQNGGASVMYDLMVSNVDGKYVLYQAKGEHDENKDRLGWDTTTLSRPKMLGEWLTAFNSSLIRIYDEETISQHQTFVVNKNGKPEADVGCHDDAVMSAAGAWQMYQTEMPPSPPRERKQRKYDLLTGRVLS